MSEMY